MRTKIWLGLAAATALMVIAPAGAANAQSVQGFFQKILGTEDDTPPINYSDRAPLVKPGKLDLPPPGSATTNASDPNWPNDPDEKKRKAAGIIPKTLPKNGDGRLSPEEMAPSSSFLILFDRRECRLGRVASSLPGRTWTS